MVPISDLSVKPARRVPGRKLTVLALIAALLASLGPTAIADDTPEQLHKMYDDALKELKASQSARIS